MVAKLKESEKQFLTLKYMHQGLTLIKAEEEVNKHIALIIVPIAR